MKGGLILVSSFILVFHAAWGCPEICICQPSSRTVDCSYRGLVEIPTQLPPETQVLYLQGNQIRTINHTAFTDINGLKILDLSNNSISTLSPYAFQVHRSLQILNLTNNFIHYLESQLFTSLPDLKELDLSFNSIFNLPESLANNSRNLTFLGVKHNQLQRIDRSLLDSFTNLKILLVKVNPWQCDCPVMDLKLWLENFLYKGRTSAASKKEMWDTIVIGVNACGNSVRDKYHCRKRFDDIRSKLKKKIQDQRVHATGTGGGPTPQRLILTPLEELLRPKLLTVVVEGLAGDRDIGIYPSQFPAVAPGGHVSPEMEQVSSPGSASSTLLEEHHGDEDDEYDEDDATEETEIQSCDHEEVPIETVVPPNRPSTSTYDAIVASEGKIVDAENRRHSDMMTVLERMIGLQEETVSQLAHLHRVFIEVPKQLQKINTSFEALVVQQTQANYWRMTNVPQFNTSQPGSVHAGQFSPHSSDIHSPGPNVTGQVADIAVQVPDDILPLPSVQIQQQTPTKEATKTKQDTHETDQPSLVQCLPTCSHVSLGTSPVREQSLPKSPVGESLPKSPVGESLPKSPVGESLPKSPVGESLATSPVGESLATSPVGEQSLPKSPVGESLATSPAREVPEATQSGSVVPKVGGKRKRKIQETTSRPVTRSQKEQKK